MIINTLFFVSICLTRCALAHGDHNQQPISPDADWATKHMLEEHHISDFDSGSFFTLHDYDSSRIWTRDHIATTYGLKDASTAHISAQEKEDAINKVLELFDRDNSGTISFAEYVIGTAQGAKLPDFGWPSHHGDDEYEYEIHHFEKYHGADTKEEDLTHPEDIEHFRKHDELEEQAERQAMLDRMPIVDANIPSKFRRHG